MTVVLIAPSLPAEGKAERPAAVGFYFGICLNIQNNCALIQTYCTRIATGVFCEFSQLFASNCLISECNKLGANAGPPVHFSKSATLKKCTFSLSNCRCMYQCSLRSRQNPTKSILLRLELLTKRAVDAFFGGKISVFIEIHSGVLIPK